MTLLNQPPKTFIDLFSGAGGFSSGFVQAGCRPLLAVERDYNAVKTHQKNFPDSIIIKDDIRNIHSFDILSKIDSVIALSPIDDSTKPSRSDSRVSGVLASPPCEPFTAANPRRQKAVWNRFYADPQGGLVFHAIRIIGDMQPEFFMIENVIPMIAKEGRSIIKEELEQMGYKAHFNFIKAEKHGCPSARNRVFISNIHFNLPKMKRTTVWEAIHDLPNPSYPHDVANHFPIPFPKQVVNKIHKIKQGEAGVYFKGASTEKKNWERLKDDAIAPTVMGKARFIHPFEDRPLTVREHARLMRFPDNFIFTGSVGAMYNQVGEAVPPIIAKLIAEKIIRSLGN